MNNNVITNIRTVPLKRLSVNDEVIPYSELSARLNELDNRLSDIQIDSDTLDNIEVANVLKTIISRFGSKRK